MDVHEKSVVACVLTPDANGVRARAQNRCQGLKDAEWIADLVQHGLLTGGFIPPVERRGLRDLTRRRANFVRERTNLVNRVQKGLEAARVKSASVATDVMGVSGRAILRAIIAGETDASTMAEWAKGQRREKRDLLARALDGRGREQHRCKSHDFSRDFYS